MGSIECAKVLLNHPQVDPNIAFPYYLNQHIEYVIRDANEELLDLFLESAKITIVPLRPYHFVSLLWHRATFDEKTLPFYEKLFVNTDKFMAMQVSSIYKEIQISLIFIKDSTMTSSFILVHNVEFIKLAMKSKIPSLEFWPLSPEAAIYILNNCSNYSQKTRNDIFKQKEHNFESYN